LEYPGRICGDTTAFTSLEEKLMRRQSNGWNAMEAQTWARRLVQREDWLAVDVETTGLDESAEIVEIGAVGPRGEAILDLLVRPSLEPDHSSTRIHGLDAKVLNHAPCFEDIYSVVNRVLTSRYVISYNAEFDRRVLDSVCWRMGLDPIDCDWECAMARYEQWRGFRSSLTTACEIEGIFATQRHRALPDALVVWRLVLKMAGAH
jgi:DNA polymerase-3 subunit epsilon